MPPIITARSYIFERHHNGFDFVADPMDATHEFARACIELGERLAKEGKTIKEITTREDHFPMRIIAVRCNVIHSIKLPST